MSEEQGAAGMVKDQECQRALTENCPGRWVRAPSGLLERLQHRVALETLCKRDSSFGAELVARETAGVGFSGG